MLFGRRLVLVVPKHNLAVIVVDDREVCKVRTMTIAVRFGEVGI